MGIFCFSLNLFLQNEEPIHHHCLFLNVLLDLTETYTKDFVWRKQTLMYPHDVLRCARRYSRGSRAVLFRPEFSSPIRGVSVHASTTRIHFCHSSWDQRALQDTGECVSMCVQVCSMLYCCESVLEDRGRQICQNGPCS